MVTGSGQEDVPLLVQLGAISAELLHNVFLAIQLLLGIICSFLQPLNLHSNGNLLHLLRHDHVCHHEHTSNIKM